MIATIKSTVFKTIIPSLAEAFNASYSEYCDEYLLRLPDPIGSGYVRGIDFDRGLGISEWSGCYREKAEITFDSAEIPPVIMLFCHEGEVEICVDGEETCRISPMQGAIVAVRNGSQMRLDWSGEGEQVRFNLLAISREKLFDAIDCYLHSAPDRMAALFRDVAANDQFLYAADYSVLIAETLHSLNQQDLTGVANTFYLKGKAWELLGLMIRQYFDGEGVQRSYRNSLGRRDVETLRRARNLLVLDLQNPPTIEELAKKTGINKNKLQSGFKGLYGMTINRYLRDVRLQHGKMLLTEDLMPISEVAERVGYSNSSQFSKRFGEKYGMLPSQYVAMIRRHRGVAVDSENRDSLPDAG